MVKTDPVVGNDRAVVEIHRFVCPDPAAAVIDKQAGIDSGDPGCGKGITAGIAVEGVGLKGGSCVVCGKNGGTVVCIV